MNGAQQPPAYDPKRIEEIRARHQAIARGEEGIYTVNWYGEIGLLLSAIDSQRKEMEDVDIDHDKDLRILLGGLEQAKEALDIAYAMTCIACVDLGRDCENCGKIDAARKRIDSLLHPK